MLGNLTSFVTSNDLTEERRSLNCIQPNASTFLNLCFFKEYDGVETIELARNNQKELENLNYLITVNDDR